jgi:putative chitinase
MLRLPGHLTGVRLGDHWIDPGTSALTQMPSPYAFQTGPVATLLPAGLSATEQRLLAALDLAGITDHNARAMFLAQISVESAGFHHLHENLHYSAARLLATFPKYVKDDKDAKALVKLGADAIANRVYGPTHKHLGNIEPGDGARYVGRGYIQLTGRDAYAEAGKALNIDLVGHPELAEDPGNATLIAIWYWNERVSHAAARLGDVRKVTLQINGGLNGLKGRQLLYRHYRRLLGAPPPRRFDLQIRPLGGTSRYEFLT